MTSHSETDLEPVGPSFLRWLDQAARAYATQRNTNPDEFTDWVRREADKLHEQETKADPTISRCSECDQTECDHRAARYLEPIKYGYDRQKLKTGEVRAQPGAFRIPNNERQRNDDDTAVRSHGKWARHNDRPAIPLLRDIVAKLEHTVFLTEELQTLVKDAYLENPHQVALLVEEIANGQKAGRLRNPGGLLVSKLRKLVE